MKKIICILLCILFAVNLCGCNLFSRRSPGYVKDNDAMLVGGLKKTYTDYNNIKSDKGNLKEIPRFGAKGSRYYTYLKQKSGYEALFNGREKECYNKIQNAVYNIQPKANVQGYYPIQKIEVSGEELNEDSIRKIVYAFRNDNPDIFWLANLFGYEFKNNTTTINLCSVLPLKECNEAINEINSKIDEVISKMHEGLSEYDREKHIYEWVTGNCNYDKNVKVSSNKWQAFTAYGAIVEGTAVCEGYSRAMQLLLSYAGIQCQLASGITNQNPHMWNVVNIEGDFYHLDATFDSLDQVRLYDYFNVTDEQIKKDHIIDHNFGRPNPNIYSRTSSKKNDQYNLDLPKCTATSANYFTMYGINIGSLDERTDEVVIEKLISLAKNRENSASFKILEPLNYYDTFDKMLSKPPYKLFYYINQANKKLDKEHQIDDHNLIHVKSGVQKAFALKINYK